MSVRGQRILSGILHDNEDLHAEKYNVLLHPQGGSLLQTTPLPSSSSNCRRRPRRRHHAKEEEEKEEPDVYGQVHPHETPQFIEEKLVEFDAEVGNIPKGKKISLQMAQERCPQLLTDTFKLQFLRCDVFRVKHAAKRYAKYWETRRNICENDELCFRKITLELLKDDELALSMGLCQLLPHKDPSGRRIMFMDSSRQDKKLHTVKSQARAAAYMAMAALEDDESTQQKGLVVIFWPARERWDQPNPEFIKLMGASLKGALPVRLSGAHVCQPPAFFDCSFRWSKWPWENDCENGFDFIRDPVRRCKRRWNRTD